MNISHSDTFSVPSVHMEMKVSNVSCGKPLGLEIDQEPFTRHVEKICKNLSQRLAILRKINNGSFLPLYDKADN